MWPAVATIIVRALPVNGNRKSAGKRLAWGSRLCSERREVEATQLLHEVALIIEAAQIHDEGTVLDAADDGPRQLSERARDALSSRVSAFAARRDRYACARKRIDRQRAAADLARARDHLHFGNRADRVGKC